MVLDDGIFSDGGDSEGTVISINGFHQFESSPCFGLDLGK